MLQSVSVGRERKRGKRVEEQTKPTLVLNSSISTNPALSIALRCSSSSTTVKLRPDLAPHSVKMGPHWYSAESFGRVPSSVSHTAEGSKLWSQPSGFRQSYARLKRAFQSSMLPTRPRMWTKSKWLSEKVQGWQQSSISLRGYVRAGLGWVRVRTYKRTLGGTQVGWMGEISVPMILVSGNSSPKSLGRYKY